MYELENKNYDFKRITTQDALKVKSMMMILANEKASIKDIETANQTLDSLALKYLTVENNGEWLENVDEYALGALFNNELAIIEISAQFQNRIKDFLQSLPTFQAGNQTAKRNK